MINIQSQFKKLYWQIPLMILILITIGNLILIFSLQGEQYSWQWFLYASANSVINGGAFIIVINTMVSILDRKLPWLHFPVKRLIFQVLWTIGLSMIIIVFAILINGAYWHLKLTSDIFINQGFFMMKITFTFLFASTMISNAIIFFKNWKEAAVQQEKLKREQLALQYETLKSQVNPHFLFNNLNSLTSLISTNPEKAIDFVKKLSEVYRYVLDQKDCELVTLETELKFLESYVYLQQIRFGSNLEVQINVSPKNYKVIPLSVQMLVENAIKHNEISDRNPLTINIFTTDDQYLVIENRLHKKAGSEGSGSGIQNIKSRYEFFTEKDLIIGISKDHFRVSIPLLID